MKADYKETHQKSEESSMGTSNNIAENRIADLERVRRRWTAWDDNLKGKNSQNSNTAAIDSESKDHR